ncbi:ubiquinol-cytochrome C reductase hinge protein-domain-containing protein [Leptodontidium sp. 2 PMI_412]|nr:ubiquinol-cytochrome C reductase hinge protein-domain-containing protein [Leptodontidium sp. 2 PMI_412]
MGFFDSFSDLLEAALPWSTAEAEAQKEEEEEDAKDAPEDSEESKDEPEEEAEEEEEEEEEEMVDPKEKLEEECKESKACSPAKHHFDECVERVTGAHEHSTDKKHPDEDCVEEFFHLAHCATSCAAPKLWATLK